MRRPAALKSTRPADAGKTGNRLLIRRYQPRDWPSVWSILEPVFRAGETYAIARDITAEAARLAWTRGPKETFVALDQASGVLIGTYYLRPNADGPGSHVCNCGYVVAEKARGKGIAARLCEHSQQEAVARGYRAMQYNLVVSTNEGAVRLWQRMGFEIIGTIPDAFDHPRAGLVDGHVMYKPLLASANEGGKNARKQV